MNEGAVHIIGKDDEVRPLGLDEIDQQINRIRVERHTRRVAGVHQEECLDLRIFKLLEVGGGELVGVLAFRTDVDDVQGVVLEVRHLEVRREDRHAQGNRIPGIEQSRRLQRLEDVAHGGGAALDRIEIERAGGARLTAHSPHQVLMNDLLVVHEHAVRHRIVVTDDAVDEFMHEGIRLEAELLDGKVDHRAKADGTGAVGVVCEPVVQACRNAGCLWHAADTRRQIHAPPALGDSELAQQKERLAWLGGDPVRVAAAGIQEGKVGLRSRSPADLDQLVLDFERTQRLVFAEADGFH